MQAKEKKSNLDTWHLARFLAAPYGPLFNKDRLENPAVRAKERSCDRTRTNG